MIALNETDPTAAEVPFFLPLTADTFTGPGLTGHGFILGEIQIKLPGAGWVNAALSQIVEKGYGRYCVRLNSSQTTSPGVVYIRTVGISGCQPYFGHEDIGQLGGDFSVGDVSARIPFFLASATDPVYGSPGTGHTFATGEVRVCTPGGSYADATIANIVEVGFGAYELYLTSGQVAARGKAFLYALVSGYQRYEGYVTILTPSGASTGTGTGGGGTTTTTGVSSPLGVSAAGYVDHVAKAVGRLPMQFRSTP